MHIRKYYFHSIKNEYKTTGTYRAGRVPCPDCAQACESAQKQSHEASKEVPSVNKEKKRNIFYPVLDNTVVDIFQRQKLIHKMHGMNLIGIKQQEFERGVKG